MWCVEHGGRGGGTFLGFAKKQEIRISLAFKCLKTSIRNQSQ